MTKIKFLILFALVAVAISACKKDLGEDFDVQAQFTKDTVALRAYAQANNIPIEKDAKYNFFYQIITPGEGEEVSPVQTISVLYTGRLLNGTIFDSATNAPLTFSLTQAITGWQAGIPLIKKGGKIRLLLPSFYAYGNQANQRIPANSPLDFTVELTDVK